MLKLTRYRNAAEIPRFLCASAEDGNVLRHNSPMSGARARARPPGGARRIRQAAPHGDMLDDKLVMVGTLWGERERGRKFGRTALARQLFGI